MMNHRQNPSSLAALAVLLSVACGDGGSDQPPLTVITGALPLYHTQTGRMNPRNDVSGATFLPDSGRLLIVDDGGDNPPDPMPLYMVELRANLRLTPVMTELAERHRKLEGAAFDGAYAYVTGTLDGQFDDEAFHAVSRFRVLGDDVADLATLRPRDTLLAALQAAGPPDWFERIRDLPGKSGGLNVEGLSAGPTRGELLFGLRSPHLGPEFPMNTRSGLAIVIRTSVASFHETDLRPIVQTLDLGGLGIRSLEYSPTARGYFVVAGPVETLPPPEHAPPHFELYFWRGAGPETVRIPIEAFGRLCRPEGLAEVAVNGRKFLMIVSEESGLACEDPPPPFNYILVEMNQALLGRLR